MIAFTFDRQKAIEAAGVILKRKDSRRLKYLLLLKMLYMADRKAVTDRLFPITGDIVYAMKFGPVLSHVKEMIDRPAEGWDDYIETLGYDVQLVKDPGCDHLSPYEVAELTSIADSYTDDDRWSVVSLTHEFPEWKKHYREGTSTQIPPEDIAEAVGRGQDIGALEEEAEEERLMSSLLDG